MNPFRREVQLLFWKEVRQLTRNTGAMLTSVFMPTVLVVMAPVLALLASKTPGYRNLPLPRSVANLPGLQIVHGAQDFFLYVTLPALFVLASLLVPILAGIYTLIVERERRSLELLMALPVVVDDIVAAKLAATMVTSVALIVPMYGVDAVVIILLTPAGTAYVLGALFLILATMVAAVGGALLLALWARDLRTATQLGGMLAGTPLFLTGLCIVLAPGLGRFVVLGLLMLFLGLGALYAGINWVTFERYVA